MKRKRLLLHYAYAFIIAITILFPACTKQSDSRPQVILLVTIDTLRQDHLGSYGYERDTSPFIDSLAENGIRYQYVVTPLPLTDPSHASILTARHPLVHGVCANAVKLPKKIETIAEVLNQNGWYTIGTVAVSHLGKAYNFHQGFDSFSDKWDPTTQHNLKWQRTAQAVNQSLFKQISQYKKQNSSKPLFIWAHYYDPHVPYINWEHIPVAAPYSDPQIEAYDKEIRYTDNALKELHAYLQKENLSNKLTTCITADHGEQLGEHGGYTVHVDIYSETVFVPLIFSGYRIPSGKTVSNYVSTMDIAPTLLHTAGLKFSSNINGMNLFDQTNFTTRKGLMVIGNPKRVRSLQWLEQPFSFILNFDHFYKQSHLSFSSDFPEAQLESVPRKSMNLQYFKKSQKYSLSFDYPDHPRTGPYIGILRMDVRHNNGLAVGCQIAPQVKSFFMLKEKETGTLTAFFPVTPLDQLSGLINFKQGTTLENFRLALLPLDQATPYLTPQTLRENTIYAELKGPRKKENRDQLFNLETDFPMTRNLLANRQQEDQQKPSSAVSGKKQIYHRLKTLRNESNRLNGTAKGKKPLTRQEKEMLKSLGYL